MQELEFQEAMNNIKHLCRSACCEKHGSYIEKGRILTNGNILWSGCQKCVAESRRQKEEKKKGYQAEKNVSKYEQLFGYWLPRAFDFPLESFEVLDAAMLKAFEIIEEYVENFDRNQNEGRGLFLMGYPGTGKTKIACGMLRKLYPKVVGCYVTICGFGDRVRQTWGCSKERNSRYTEAELMRTVCETPILVLDEIGTIKKDHDGELLFKIIDTRYSNLLPTICISNLSLSELADLYGERFSRRIVERNKIIVFDWVSWHQRLNNE